MKKLIGLVVLVAVVGAVGWMYAAGDGLLGDLHGGGQIVDAPRPVQINAQKDAEDQVAAGILERDTKQIVFGDLHVHSTFSPDAFIGSLPAVQGEGAHPVSDACDFARYCANLDFWGITDHAMASSKRKWEETKRVIRECNAAAGDPANPDMVSYLGFEWTQIGSRAENHYGHKNVFFVDTEEDKVPTRPIAANPPKGSLPYGADKGVPFWMRLGVVLMNDGGGPDRQPYYDSAAFAKELGSRPICEDKPVRELSAECLEWTKDPAGLFAKLNDWGFETLVIPHGTTWGFYTPHGVSLDKQLTAEQDDADMQRMFEVFSGHGNSELYRDWRAATKDEAGNWVCPEPTEGYLPSCWRAGEIIRERCEAAGESAESCDEVAAKTRALYLEGKNAGFRTVPGVTPQDWLNAGQCQDCWLPSFNYRPGNSGQYALAITNFDDPEKPRRFHWAFMASSDNHQARAGTGYKEFARRGHTESISLGGMRNPLVVKTEADSRPMPFDPETSDDQNFDLTEIERQGSFFLTGGLIAAHSDGRDRRSIWDSMQRRETYGTSGERILLWFDMINGQDGRVVMGERAVQASAPTFEVRAMGSFKQKPGCPDYSNAALGAEDIERICMGECYNPSDVRNRIERIEIIRIRPQAYEGEPVAGLIQDPWKVISCDASLPAEAGCSGTITDDEYASSGRDATYYARVVQEAQPTVNGGLDRCEFDEDGNCIKVNLCSGNYNETDPSDDCLQEKPELAWSSPIYVLQPNSKVAAAD